MFGRTQIYGEELDAWAPLLRAKQEAGTSEALEFIEAYERNRIAEVLSFRLCCCVSAHGSGAGGCDTDGKELVVLGDAGHGTCIVSVGCWYCFQCKAQE